MSLRKLSGSGVQQEQSSQFVVEDEDEQSVDLDQVRGQVRASATKEPRNLMASAPLTARLQPAFQLSHADGLAARGQSGGQARRVHTNRGRRAEIHAHLLGDGQQSESEEDAGRGRASYHRYLPGAGAEKGKQ